MITVRRSNVLLRLASLAGLVAIASACFGQQDPPQWSSAASYVGGGLVRATDGNYYRALKNNTNHNPTADNHTYWELYYVRTNTVLKVATSGARFSSLRQAWAMLSSATIPATGSATISIAGGTGYTEIFNNASLNLDHENGARVKITGDDPAKIHLQFTSGYDGIVIDGGHRLGGINNVTIDGVTPSGFSVGIHVMDHSSLGNSNVHIYNFVVGLYADMQSHAQCDNSFITQFTQAGILSRKGSFVHAQQVSVTNGAVAGIEAFDSSTVFADYATVDTITNGAGFQAGGGSKIDAAFATANKCTTGFKGDLKSLVDADGGTASHNAVGFSVSGGSFLDASSNVVSGNVQDYSQPVNMASTDTSYIKH